MRKTILLLGGLLFAVNSYADTSCTVNVTIDQCFHRNYNVVANVIDNNDMALPVIKGDNNSRTGPTIEFVAKNCSNLDQVRIKASAIESGPMAGTSLAAASATATVVEQFSTKSYDPGKILSANFPADFEDAKCPTTQSIKR